MAEPHDVVVAENQRLLKEVRQLRAKVAAFESSRWWRMHPRFALRRLRPADNGAARAEATPQTHPSSDAGARVAERFRAEVVARGTFGHDWFTEHIPTWETVLSPLEGRRSRVLELGSFEGMSACFLLWRLPQASLTCVDTFAGSPEHSPMGVDDSALEELFDRNVALVDETRVRKIVGTSAETLLELAGEEARFDLIYVDASHLALDVVVDAALAWQLLSSGGFLIFDDYDWRSPLGEDPFLLPGPAVDAFLGLVAAHCDLVAKGRQAIVRKKSVASGA